MRLDLYIYIYVEVLADLTQAQCPFRHWRARIWEHSRWWDGPRATQQVAPLRVPSSRESRRNESECACLERYGVAPRAIHTYSFKLTPPEGATQESHQPRSSRAPPPTPTTTTPHASTSRYARASVAWQAIAMQATRAAAAAPLASVLGEMAAKRTPCGGFQIISGGRGPKQQGRECTNRAR
jgi:hypothetical protein